MPCTYEYLLAVSFIHCLFFFYGCISYFHLMTRATTAARCFPPVDAFSLDACIRCALYQFSSAVRSIRPPKPVSAAKYYAVTPDRPRGGTDVARRPLDWLRRASEWLGGETLGKRHRNLLTRALAVALECTVRPHSTSNRHVHLTRVVETRIPNLV